MEEMSALQEEPMREEITLTIAAFRLGMSYERAKRLLLTGAIEGRQDNGKWSVYADSVARYRQDAKKVGAQLATA